MNDGLVTCRLCGHTPPTDDDIYTAIGALRVAIGVYREHKYNCRSTPRIAEQFEAQLAKAENLLERLEQ